MDERARRASVQQRLEKIRRRYTIIEDESLDFYHQNRKIRSQLKVITDQYAFDKFSIEVEGKGNRSVASVRFIFLTKNILGCERAPIVAKTVKVVHLGQLVGTFSS